MPGRGQPWKKGGHIDDTIQGEDIEDGTIEEVDLSTAVQTKLNAGGGIDIFNTAFLQEEFLWDASDLGAFTQKYTLESGTIQSGGLNLSRNGIIAMTTSGAGAGDPCEIDSGNGFIISPSAGDVTMKQVIAVDSLTNSMIDASMIDSAVGIASSEAVFFSAIGEGFGFIFDPSISANWRLWTKNAGTTTVTTSVPVVSSALIKLKATKTTGLVTFNINGTDVGTINTNIPVNEIFIHTGCFNKTTIQQSMELDAWEVQAVRA